MPDADELAAAAVDAFLARTLEERAEHTTTLDAQQQRNENDLRAVLADIIGEAQAETLDVEHDDAGAAIAAHPLMTFRMETASGLHALVTCPTCGTENVRTRDLEDLADLGAVIAQKARLTWHHAASGGSCDGIKREDLEEREPYRVRQANTPKDLEEMLTSCAEHGYRPINIMQGTRGEYVIVGRRIGGKYHAHLDVDPDDEAFL